MSAAIQANATVQVYQVYIKAAPEAIWDAITRPDWAKRYGYRSPVEYELRPGGEYRAFATSEMTAHGAPDVIITGEVIEVDPPRRLVQTWHPLFSPETAAEPSTRVTWEIEAGEGGVTKLTLIHDLEGAPMAAAQVAGAIPGAGGGWSFILSDLKTLLETGQAFAG